IEAAAKQSAQIFHVFLMMLFRRIELYEARRLPEQEREREREGERKSSQIFVEPCDGLIHSVSLVFRFDEKMAFARINDQLCRHAEGFQRVPEFVRLRCRAFRVALADDDEGRGLYILDEVNGRTFLVNGRIIVNGCAE